MDKDLELRVKEYNRQHKEALEEYNKAKAQISVYENEINSLCAELTNSLGIEVTKENALEIYKQKENEIRQQLEVGENIIKRINSEEAVSENDLNTVQGVVANLEMPEETLGEAPKTRTESAQNSSNVQQGNNTASSNLGAFNGFFNTSVDDI